MNLKHLFEMQRALDNRIIEEKGLEGQDLLPEKVLALQVELGELANEWRGFKFWSENREPRNFRVLSPKYPSGGNPLLEEYVDCLHFILSIGLEHGFDDDDKFQYLHEGNFHIYTELDTIKQFTSIYKSITEFLIQEDLEAYEEVFLYFIGLSKQLGFTWEQIEKAYKEKNATNHLRQSNGY